MAEIIRGLAIYADDLEVFSGNRVKVFGYAAMNCYPDAWQVDVYGDPDDFGIVSTAKTIKVTAEADSVVVFGSPKEVHRHTDMGMDCVTIIVSDGHDFYTSRTSISAESGMDRSEVLRAALAMSTAKIDVAGIHPMGKIMRGMSYSGRTVNLVDNIAKTAGVKLYTSRGALKSETGDPPADIYLRYGNEDILDTPESVASGIYIIQTSVVGIAPGQWINVDDDTLNGTFLVVSVTTSADTTSGDWWQRSMIVDKEAVKNGWSGAL